MYDLIDLNNNKRVATYANREEAQTFRELVAFEWSEKYHTTEKQALNRLKLVPTGYNELGGAYAFD